MDVQDGARAGTDALTLTPAQTTTATRVSRAEQDVPPNKKEEEEHDGVRVTTRASQCRAKSSEVRVEALGRW